MLKDKILQKCGTIMDEWLLGFNKQTDFNVSMFSTEKVNIRNAIMNTQRVNEELRFMNSPLMLKAGLIGRISIKVSAAVTCDDLTVNSVSKSITFNRTCQRNN